MTSACLAPVRSAFHALAVTIVPEARALDAAGWADLERLVEEALAGRPAKVRWQLRLLVFLLQWLPLLFYGRPFTRLDPPRRARFLAGVEDARLVLLRRGFWGLRTLVLLGYYGRAAAAAEVGYRADRRGWEARE